MAKPNVEITQRIDGKVTEAKCTACDEPLDLGNDVGSAKEQQTKLFNVFGKHLREKHTEDFSQTAARIVREATENK